MVAPTGSTSLQITVTDAAGVDVRHITVKNPSGLTNFTWDGSTDAGGQAPSGTYKFSAIATVNGKSQGIDTALVDKVNSVTIDSSTNTLALNTSDVGTVKLSDVLQVR